MTSTKINGVIKTQIVLTVAILICITLCATAANAQGGSQGPEGTWKVRVTVEDAPPGFPVPFDALETYSRGGGIVTSNNNPLVPRPGQGAWRKIGNDDYAASIIFFFFGPAGTPIGTVEVTHRFRINGDHYGGSGEANFKDLDGGPLFPEHPGAFTFITRAQRILWPNE
jgi:hypothetical protein